MTSHKEGAERVVKNDPYAKLSLQINRVPYFSDGNFFCLSTPSHSVYDAKQVLINMIFNKLGFVLRKLYSEDYSLV